MIVNRFDGEYHFLSNFYRSPLVLDGLFYDTVEHAYQAAKATDPEWAHIIRTAETPGKAKRLGKRCPCRGDWEAYKYLVMDACLEAKFSDDVLRQRLLATGDAVLIEGNTWGDTYWGVCDGKGKNMLGRLLMQTRKRAYNGSSTTAN